MKREILTIVLLLTILVITYKSFTQGAKAHNVVAKQNKQAIR